VWWPTDCRRLPARQIGGDLPALHSASVSATIGPHNKSGKFRFHRKAANGESIAASQGYETKKVPIKALSRSS
jgi:hypothetical protein